MEAFHKPQDSLILLFSVHPDGLEVISNPVSQNSLDNVVVMVQQGRRGTAFGPVANVEPLVVKEQHVSANVFFADSLARCSHDETARHAGAVRLNDLSQANAFLVGGNLPGYTDVIHRRHVDQKAARQGNMRGDAGAFSAEGFLGDLNQHLLTFREQIGNLSTRVSVACA